MWGGASVWSAFGVHRSVPHQVGLRVARRITVVRTSERGRVDDAVGAFCPHDKGRAFGGRHFTGRHVGPAVVGWCEDPSERVLGSIEGQAVTLWTTPWGFVS